jgi:hypothetical protein
MGFWSFLHRTKQKKNARKKAYHEEKLGKKDIGKQYGQNKRAYNKYVNMLKKQKPEFKKFETLRPEQRQLVGEVGENFRQNYGGGVGGQPIFEQGQDVISDYLSRSPEAQSRFNAPYLRQFREDILPALRERLTGGDESRTSAFENLSARAATDLQERLAALHEGYRAQMPGQALQYAGAPSEQAQNLLPYALHPTFNRVGIPAPSLPAPPVRGIGQRVQPNPVGPSAFAKFAAPVMHAGATAAGAYYGGPAGAAVGSGIGQGIGNMMGVESTGGLGEGIATGVGQGLGSGQWFGGGSPGASVPARGPMPTMPSRMEMPTFGVPRMYTPFRG